ncbi:MAG: MBOAT family O-acyltransferase [Bacteroidia bacterium]
MIFASNLFLLYFLPVFLTVYLVTPQRLRNAVLLLGSLVFYAWGAPKFIFVLLGLAVADYLVALQIGKGGPHAKKWLTLAVVYNLSALVYFKYANFFIENTNSFLGALGIKGLEWTEVALPLGISFVTFQQLSYLVDVYRGEKPPLKNPIDYFTLIMMFPHLVAGPILRYRDMADQIRDRREQDNFAFRLEGMIRFAIGLARKVIIADTLSTQVNKIFLLPHQELDFVLVWIGAVGYSLVLYHDFAGYSDMAIGLARMLGFRFPENFNLPYTATSLRETWRRWHMTLTGFFRNYVFKPLMKRSKKPWMLYANLWIVFLLSGLWHGAAWTFVCFGIWNGVWLMLERLFLEKWMARLPQFLRIIWAYMVFMMGVVIFKSPDLGTAFKFFREMFAFEISRKAWEDLHLVMGTKFWFMMVLAGVIAFAGAIPKLRPVMEREWRLPVANWKVVAWTAVAGLLLILCVSEIATMGFRPFIYYMF